MFVNIAHFLVDDDRCIGCGKCTLVCPGGILYLNENNKARMKPVEAFGWNGCWQCEHCLSVCPEEAISIFGHQPENSLPPENTELSSLTLDALMANRHSCRRYRDENVDRDIIEDMILRLAHAPNGGNKQQVEFALIDDKEQMRFFRRSAYEEMERLAKQGIYPDGFDQASYKDMKRWEKTVRPDMLFCGAPHILIPHAPMVQGTPVQDVIIAGAYFELLCASRGLGCVMLTFPLDVMSNMPEFKAMLQIPENHYVGMILGFGYPQIPYARGSQRTVDCRRIHRITFEESPKEA